MRRYIDSVELIYFLPLNNALHHILLYNFWIEKVWMVFFNLFVNLDNFEPFHGNFIPLKQGNFIEDLI